MKRYILEMIFVLTLFLFFIVGCSSGGEEAGGGKVQGDKPSAETTKDNKTVDGSEGAQDESDGTADEDGDADETSGDLPSGDVKSQSGLKMGETALIESTAGKYEVTLNSAKYADEVGGRESIEEVYLIVDVTVKNVGKKILEASAVQGSNIEVDGSYFDNVADVVGGVKLLKGKLSPYESTDGELLFEIRKGKTYKLVFGQGLGVVMNKVEWEFDASEVK
ncbi:DUF4352 domain-containing protein [Numidum massiliense]|uniref:DUF4352 domain-containing protein n=1 Tax=Numidum massiliense TaxID=1522315 RepID=UPI0006D55658|nr:DUF4352 domain-containing protein [Numidum massiliense]